MMPTCKTIKEELKELDNKKEFLLKQLEKQNTTNLKYVIVRTENAGVFAGHLYKEFAYNDSVILHNAKRIWYWAGAASLSELAMKGTSKPDECKFPCEVSEIKLNQVIEIIKTTDKAQESIQNVKVWSEHE